MITIKMNIINMFIKNISIIYEGNKKKKFSKNQV